MSLQLIPAKVIEAKVTDITNTTLDMRSLFTVDTSLAANAGFKKIIYKQTYSGAVEKLAKGAENDSSTYGSVTLASKEYDVSRYQHTFEYNDMDVMEQPSIIDVLTDGAGTTIANEIKTEYFTELDKISNRFAAKGYTSIYEAAVDAVAALPKAAEKDITDLFLVMGADGRAKVRKDKLFEAARQGEIIFTGQFGTICGIPCVYSNLVPKNVIYLTEKPAITFFVKKEGSVETDRNIKTKDNTVVYERHGVIALTDDTRSAQLELNTVYTAVTPVGTEDPSEEGWFELATSGMYVPTADETVDNTKTYYSVA